MEPKKTGSFITAGRVLIAIGVLVLLLAVGTGWAMASNFDNLGNLVKVVAMVRSQGIYKVSVGQMMEGAISGMVDSLNDPYSVYMTPTSFNQLQQQIQGSFAGLGMVVTINQQNSYLTVKSTIKGTPAQQAGIGSNDAILKIDSRDTKGMDLETAVGLLRGPVGSKVTLTVARGGPTGAIHSVAMVRQQISVPTVASRMIAPGIGYVAISQFSENTPDEMKAQLMSLLSQGLQGLILDLRDNPGGELQSSVNVARFFLPKGSPVVYIQSNFGQDVLTQTEDRLINVPVVVLVNGNTASAAEILSGAIQDTGVGILVGTKTFGKGVVQTVYPLSGGAGLKLTTARYLTPAKHDIQHKGIEPNVVVANPESNKPDLQLDAALKIMLEKVKVNAA
ncbi:MAG TPA: S41 family peptidase [Spirochaetia bacterium]|nr:S41 family peptidase [Spirochaetia bacterium]